jgi:hypothetical protein
VDEVVDGVQQAGAKANQNNTVRSPFLPQRRAGGGGGGNRPAGSGQGGGNRPTQ